MKILIATSNNAKYNTISKMIKSILGNEIMIDNLLGFKDFVDIEETGSNLDRARSKALNALNQIDEYDYVLGIDDGIIIGDVIYTEVKSHLNDIIVSDKVPVGTKIYITRAYCLIHNNEEKCCLNKIPYIVQKKLDSYASSGYQLNSVISTIDNNTVLDDRTEVELNEYYLEYSLDDLKRLFNI